MLHLCSKSFLNSKTLLHNCCFSYITHSKLLVLETCSTPLHLSLLPTSPDTHLLSACDDGLCVFDIELSKNTQKRFEFSISSNIIIPLLINLCGKEKQIFIEIYFLFFCLFFSRNEEMEIVFPVYKKKDKKNTYRTIDGLSFLSDDIVGE